MHPVYWTKPKIIDALRTWIAENGRTPVKREWMPSPPGCPSLCTIRRVCGTWTAAIVAAGGEQHPTCNPSLPDHATTFETERRRSIIEFMRLLRRAGLEWPRRSTVIGEASGRPDQIADTIERLVAEGIIEVQRVDERDCRPVRLRLLNEDDRPAGHGTAVEDDAKKERPHERTAAAV